MRKIYYWILLTALPITLSGCNETSESISESENSSITDMTSEKVFTEDMYYVEPEVDPNFHKDVSGFSSSIQDIEEVYKPAYEDKTLTINKSDITYGETYINGNRVDFATEISANDDSYSIFYGANQARVVSRAKGYAITLPTSTILETNFQVSKHRAQFATEDYKITITQENQNPYNNWQLYHDEWLTRYIVGDKTNYEVKRFIQENTLEYVRDNFVSNSLISGYAVEMISIMIGANENIEMPYYNIAIIRKPNEVKDFSMLVLKSKVDMSGQFNKIVSSFANINKFGKSYEGDSFQLKVPSYLSDETQRYYKKMIEQNYTEWGFFNHSMVDNSGNHSLIEEDNINQKEWMDHSFGLAPTYTHCGLAYDTNPFPIKEANYFAGGNGFNGKPVLQFTMQFTSSNNSGLGGYTPMYDILRGRYDTYFKELAASLKEYGKPVLFRLNNEMNTDWTSYCGMVTLLDPDIFKITWERMANIFKEEGVDNVLYIFNPIAISCPFSSWGDALCYVPSLEYVQFLGLTYYERNNYLNGEEPASFYEMYLELYEKNCPFWSNYPAIISEFGCGAGGNYQDGQVIGERYRNSLNQAVWVEEMFNCLNYCRDEAFIDQIKGAVWFNANDYYGQFVMNQFELDNINTRLTIEAFKAGLADTTKLRNGENLQ